MNKDNTKMKGKDFFALAFGSMVGLGWVTSSPLWVGNAGGLGAIIACVIVTLLIIPIGLCFCELTCSSKVMGGEFAWISKYLGKGVGFIGGWFLFLAYLFMQPWMCISVISIVDYLFPSLQVVPLWTIGGYTMYLPSTLIALALIWIIVTINLKGIQSSKAFQNVTTWILIGAVAIFVGASLIFGDIHNFTPLFNEQIGAFPGMFLALGSIAFFMTGFDTIPKMLDSADGSISYRNIGRVMVGTLLIGGLFYALIIVAVGFLAGGSISTMIGNLPAVAEFGRVTGSKALEYILLLGGFCGILSSMNGFMASGAKATAYFCQSNFLPASWGAINKKTGLPSKILVFWGVFTTVFVLLGKTLLAPLITLEGVLLFIVWALVCLANIRSRKAEPDIQRPFKVAGGTVVMWIGFITSSVFVILSLVPGTSLSIGKTEYLLLAVFSVLAVIVYCAYSRNHNITLIEKNTLK